MNTRNAAWLRVAAAATLLVSAGSARAVLRDHGPQDPQLTFPLWYRDLNGLAMSECLSQTPSPNPNAGGFPMCFALAPNPQGFPGNVGDEIFYTNLTAHLGDRASQGAAFFLTYVAALEAAYLSGTGIPARGSEIVFSRIRVVAHITTPGTYKVTHPYGVEVFPDVEAGSRAIFFTSDVPVGPPLDFNGALHGAMGPFPQWDFVDPGVVLDIRNPITGVTESFAGDPSLDHTFIGSPFGTNYVRVDGPPGSNLDGFGNDFIQTPLATVLGQKWTAPIATPLNIKRSTFTRDPVKNVVGIDVWASSGAGDRMILSGVNVPSVEMIPDGAGNYFAHLEMPATQIPPASISVTNVTSIPPNTAAAALVDVLTITSATYDTLTNSLNVTATSSDQVATPVLTVVGPLGGVMTAGSYALAPLPPGVLAPRSISVQSSAGGLASSLVLQLPGLPMNPLVRPVAVADAFSTLENAAAAIDVSANDAVTAPATVDSVLVITPPASGTAVPALTGGVVTYTPNFNFYGTDTFEYVLVDSTGAMSNVATATVSVVFVPPPPIAQADDFAMIRNTVRPLKSRTYNVVANDLAAAGTTLNPASVTITTAPLHGTAVANADGTITYTPALAYIGADSLQYTVSNTAGIVSAPATVSVTVFGSTEVLSIVKALYVRSKQQWTVTGATSWFGPTLTKTTVTCRLGTTATGALVGSSPVDVLGAWAVVPPAPSAPPPDATRIFTCRSSNGAQVTASVTIK